MHKLTIFPFLALASLFSLLLSKAVSAELADGTLIKGSGPGVYWYVGGSRYVFPSDKVYFSWFKDFTAVATVSDESLSQIPIGGNVTYRPGIKMVKITTDPKVYAVGRGGVLYWITSEALAKNIYGYSWSKQVDDVPDAFFVNYVVGSPIFDTRQVDLAQQTSDTPTPSNNLRRFALLDLPAVVDTGANAVANQTASSSSAVQETAGFKASILSVNSTRTTPDGWMVTVKFTKPATGITGRLFNLDSGLEEPAGILNDLGTVGEMEYKMAFGIFVPDGKYKYVIQGTDKATGEKTEVSSTYTVKFSEFYPTQSTVSQPAGGAYNSRDLLLEFNYDLSDAPNLQTFSADSSTAVAAANVEKISDKKFLIHYIGLQAGKTYRYRFTATRSVEDSLAPKFTTHQGFFTIGNAPIVPNYDNATTTSSTQSASAATASSTVLQLLSIGVGDVSAGIGNPWDSKKLTAHFNKTPRDVKLEVSRVAAEGLVDTNTFDWGQNYISNNQVDFTRDVTSLWQNAEYSYTFTAHDENGNSLGKTAEFKTSSAQALRSVSGTVSLSTEKSTYGDDEPIQFDVYLSTNSFEEWNIKQFTVREEGSDVVYVCPLKFNCHVNSIPMTVEKSVTKRYKAIVYDDQSNRLESGWLSITINPSN